MSRDQARATHRFRPASLDALNFLLADVRGALGPYLHVFLVTQQQWNQSTVGLVTALSGWLGLAMQTPIGAAIDTTPRKRGAIVVTLAVLAAGAVCIFVAPRFWPVLVANAAMAVVGDVFAPAVAGLTLGLGSPQALARRLGRNAAFDHAGNGAIAAVAGAVGWLCSQRAVFLLAPVCAVLAAATTLSIPAAAIDARRARGAQEGQEGESTPAIASPRVLLACRPLVIFGGCTLLFHLANAPLLPLVGQKLAVAHPTWATAMMSSCIIAAQLVMAPLAVLVGRTADTWGRKPLLRITAPLSGRVGLRLVDPGNFVQTTDTTGIVVLTQLQPIAVVFTIPEDNIPSVLDKLNAGAHLPVEAYDRAAQRLLATGSLLTLDNEVDQTTGTVKLKAVFPNIDNHLFPNQFVNARLQLDVKRGATVVPAVAIQRSPRGPFVYVVKPDRQSRRARSRSVSPTAMTSRSTRGCASGSRSWPMAPTACATAAVWRCRQGAAHEPVPSVHPATRRHHAADGGHPARRGPGLPPAAGLRPARGGLPDHPGGHLLPRGQSRRHGVRGHGAPGAAVRADAGPAPDDLHELQRQLGHRLAVRPEPRARRRRAGGAGGHQRGCHAPAERSAEPAGVQQGEPCRCADPDAGADVDHPAAAAGRGSRRHPAGPEDRPAAERGAGQHQLVGSGRPCACRPTRWLWRPTT
jgi:MFS family permease